MRTLVVATVAAVGLALVNPPPVSAQIYPNGNGAVTYYYPSPSYTVYYTIPAYAYGGPISFAGPPRTYGPRDYYTYSPSYSTNRGFFSPYRSDFGSAFSPYRSDYGSAYSPYFSMSRWYP
jgi:hypothetical protein